MDEKERKGLIETIKTRVSVWENKTYEFADYINVTLENGNRFQAYKLRIERHDVYNDVMVSLYDDIIGGCECYLQHLTDESLVAIAMELPMTHTIAISYYNEKANEFFSILDQPIRANFTKEDFENWLHKNFPLFDWEYYKDGFLCYTEFTDHTGPYLCAGII